MPSTALISDWGLGYKCMKTKHSQPELDKRTHKSEKRNGEDFCQHVH